MMRIRILVKKVDHDGFNGRDHPPLSSDEGQAGYVTNLDFVPDEDVDPNGGYQVFHAVLDNGHKVELMGHEIELMSCVHDGDL